MASVNNTRSTLDASAGSPLPAWLAKHAKIDFSADDIAALINSIDSSQKSQKSSLVQLPAEVLLIVLEHVPVDYILEWRLVCRGFRDAIDGRVLYHHLQRTQLIGFIGAYDTFPMTQLTLEQYEQLYLLHADFRHVEHELGIGNSISAGAIWNSQHAIFQIKESWFEAFRDIVGTNAATYNNESTDGVWMHTLDKLQLHTSEQGFGTLRWCIKLDHAVLDLSFPLDLERNPYKLEVQLDTRTIRVEWRNMLCHHLKTEAAVRRMFDERKNDKHTFSAAEDCLRQVRRQRMHAGLNPDIKKDRHAKWALRLLRPLFAKPQLDRTALEAIENTAASTLLLLRREATMTSRQLAYLRQLNDDRQIMDSEIDKLSKEFHEFASHLKPTLEFSFPIPLHTEENVPRNPIAWPDELLAIIEKRVSKWKSQRKFIRQMYTQLISSNEALTVPEDSFDDLGSQI